MNTQILGLRFSIKGIVQGVGFRPFVYSAAVRNHLTGWVNNTSSGIEIELNGCQQELDQFIIELKTNLPPLARIDQMQVSPVTPNGYTEFTIIPSQPQPGEYVPISPDMSICPDCQRELFDPSNRRYRYPFINCTNCGPRFSIIQDVPYDRPKTTMSGFPMCTECKEEYENPLDRRFHAQPIACPTCGPHVWFVSGSQKLAEKESAIQLAREWLKEGKILAVKGLGGYHLVCDALNPQAVSELRRRKKRSDKPFALMAYDLSTMQKYCYMDDVEKALLTSPQHPIVLLKKLPVCSISEEAAPRQLTLGFMLPYTPLHLLLLQPEPGFPDALVMTSGNMSEEPIAYEDSDATSRLDPIVDGFLFHNRPIHMRIDDSVTAVFDGQPYPIRRSRGYAPDAVQLPYPVPQILACGPELKNTFCLTRDRYAFISHHIGDLENYETLRSFESGILHFENLFRIKPELIAADLHPDYLATRYALQRSLSDSLPLIQVQHHHAHLASCLADNGWDTNEPVIGIILDGTGYGTDGKIWGGEVLLGGYKGYERRYHLEEFPLPGGEAAIRTPARIALAALAQSNIDWDCNLPPLAALCSQERSMLHYQISSMINTPMTTSMGRLFDAVSALIGVREKVNYEGQAAIELETFCDPEEKSAYHFEFSEDKILLLSLWEQILNDLAVGTKQGVISARFHNGLAELFLDLSLSLRQSTGIDTVALSGGVWQNRTLLTKTVHLFRKNGFKILLHQNVPTNDGGISLGQIMVAATSELR